MRADAVIAGPAAGVEAQAQERSIDIAFDIAATTLPDDYRASLRRAVCALLSWLEDEPNAGIHALAPVTAQDTSLLVSRRARLVLRIPASRKDDALQLCGQTVRIGTDVLRIGAPHVKQLAPFPTVAAAFVASMGKSDIAHQQSVEAMLDAIELPRRLICGRLTRIRVDDRELLGASAVVHELEAADSVRLQEVGLGPHRMLGCGLFVPYRTIGGIH